MRAAWSRARLYGDPCRARRGRPRLGAATRTRRASPRRRTGSVEAAVDEGLDPAAGRAEEGGDGERRASDRQVVTPGQVGERGLEADDDGEVEAGEPGRQDAVDERLADDEIDVVEAVLQDRDPRGHRDRRHGHEGDQGRDVLGSSLAVGEVAGEDSGNGEEPGARNPLDLLALFLPGPAETDDQGGSGQEQQGDARHPHALGKRFE